MTVSKSILGFSAIAFMMVGGAEGSLSATGQVGEVSVRTSSTIAVNAGDQVLHLDDSGWQ